MLCLECEDSGDPQASVFYYKLDMLIPKAKMLRNLKYLENE